MGLTWYERSIRVIEASFRENRRLEREQGVAPMSDLELVASIRVYDYPFGSRRHWPYKVWLRAIRDWRELLEHRGPLLDRFRHVPVINNPNQLDIFGGSHEPPAATGGGAHQRRARRRRTAPPRRPRRAFARRRIDAQ